MMWDFAEGIRSRWGGRLTSSLPRRNWEGVRELRWQPQQVMHSRMVPHNRSPDGKVVSTDPPYYDNIGYADLSDFFYVWLRRSMRPVFPDLFATLAVPKAEELVATPYRHGSKEKAEAFFLDGMTQAMHRLAEPVASGVSGHHLLCIQAGGER